MNELGEAAAFEEPGDLLRLDEIAFGLLDDILQFPGKPELLCRGLDKASLEKDIVHVENDHLLRLPLQFL